MALAQSGKLIANGFRLGRKVNNRPSEKHEDANETTTGRRIDFSRTIRFKGKEVEFQAKGPANCDET